jgi:hypothetical protein
MLSLAPFFFLDRETSNINLETKTAVNMLAVIPMMSVKANPRMGPVPNWKRKMAAMMVVTLASRMVRNAREKPDAIELKTLFPCASSSLMRSKTRTLASTAIPMVRMIPAMPGTVRLAWK